MGDALAQEQMEIERKSPGKNHLAQKRAFFPWLVLFVSLCLVLGLGYWWFYLRGRVSTDDAYVMAHTASISPRIDGTVSEVLVDNDEPVKEGQVLVRLDPRDDQVAVDKAQAVVARMDADIRASEINLELIDRQTQGQVQAAEAALGEAKKQEQVRSQAMDQLKKQRLAAEAELTYAQREFNRYEQLYREGTGSKEKRDDALTVFRKAQADLDAVDHGIAGSQDALGASRKNSDQAAANLEIARSNVQKVAIERYRVDSLRAQKKEAQASLEEAALHLSYCTIKAPISGHIAQRSVQVGDRVKTGQPVMAIVPLHAVYVEANFKETQLEHVRPGQPATVEADIYPGYVYHGRVFGIGAGTGAAFSLLPPQNATGNWIKIVQRVPVKIVFDQPLSAEYPLRVGLSLEVTIDLRKPASTAEKTTK
jgi:membrane fusion protein (multidrug efflux system)